MKQRIIQSNNDILILRETRMSDYHILEHLEDELTNDVLIIGILLCERWNDQTYLNPGNILGLTAESFSELSEHCLQSIAELKAIDYDTFLTNVWRLSGGNFNYLPVYQEMNVKDYIKIIDIHNRESKIQNAKMNAKMNGKR